MKPSLRSLYLLAATVLAGSLAGCGAKTAPVTPPPSGSYPGVTFAGKAMAGTQPITGAAIQLYAAGTTGNGSAATSLLSAALTTDATGAFTVPAGYPCPAATSQLYLVARGGKIGTSPSNSSITLLTPVGACNQVTASAQFTINEVTTVASAWALSQFLSTGANIGATVTNAQGLANAVATAANLVNLTTGTAPGAGFPATGTSPAPKLNSLANLLNACTTSAVTSISCFNLVFATATGPTFVNGDTLDAVLRIVRNPANNVAAVYTESTASSAFAPVLSKAPADWTLFINYTGGGMDSPGGLGIDAIGNIWVASYFSAVSEFSPTGNPLYPKGITTGGLQHSYGLAIDAQNDVWVPNEDSASSVNGSLGSVTVLSSTGQPVSGATGYAAGGLNYPISIAIDTNATAWIVDYGNSHVTLLSSTGQPLSGTTGYTTPLFQFPVAVAIDASHNGWIANLSDVTVTKVSPDGKQFTNYSCCNGASGLAIDQGGNIWVSNYYGDSISELSSAGAVISNGYTGGGIAHPQGIAIDGSGDVWVANYRGPSITKLAGATSSSPGHILSPTAGFAPDANLLEAYAIAVDASGNLWVTNFGNNTLTEFVGLAAPVKTPLIGLPQAP